MKAKIRELDQTPHVEVSDLGLRCLHMSHEKNNMLITFNNGKTATKSFSWWVTSHVLVIFLFKIHILKNLLGTQKSLQARKKLTIKRSIIKDVLPTLY